MLSEALASVLRSGREHFNAEFNAARRQYPELDGQSFSTFLVECLDPLARAAAAACPERSAEIVLAAYEVGLELVAQQLAGPRARQRSVDQAWQRVVPLLVTQIGEAPAAVLAALSNAVYQLVMTPGARPEQWLELMARLGPGARSADELLQLGQLCAWRAGLAHYRSGALLVADAMPPELVLPALGAAPGWVWPELRVELQREPWLDPSSPTRGPRLAVELGRYRGFGGLFTEPPRVLAQHGQLIVISADEAWLVTFDAFGATLHRAHPDEVRGGRIATSLPAGVRAGERKLHVNGAELDIPLLGALTSVAFDARTIALTCSLSHAVLFVAWEQPA
jgi:hypothetical protein